MTAAIAGTAKFSIQQYTLTVKPNGGTWSGSTSDQTFTQYYGTTKTIADPAARTGYTFTGWTKGGTGTWTASSKTFTFGAGAGTGQRAEQVHGLHPARRSHSAQEPER